jgi:RNA-directed DNA polymerase
MSRLPTLLARETGLNLFDVTRIVANAPVRYKTYTIPKRNGGTRLISQPARELKALQRILVQYILSDLPVHSSATAYRIGISIRSNAEAHARNGPILKFDFQDFFPSITSADWRSYCESHALFDDPDDITISTSIFFHRHAGKSLLRLAIGAPSSPMLSNVLMHDFDARISAAVAKDNVTYTRYADDLTFSANRTGFLTHVRKSLQLVMEEITSPKLRLNESKTVLATRKYKRQVTGLILSNDGAVSLGHRRKREIRAALHYYMHGRLDFESQAKLAGTLAFVNNVEPEFLRRLRQKYGGDLISRLKSTVSVQRSFRRD